MSTPRDHGGGIDAAAAQYGGAPAEWLDLSTGINPVPYPIGPISEESWTRLPDKDAQNRLIDAARRFWSVPDGVGIFAAPGASALIARMPQVLGPLDRVHVAKPTYNEWEAAFAQAGGTMWPEVEGAAVAIHVHPNNPDGKLAPPPGKYEGTIRVYDESFADCAEPGLSHVPVTPDPRVLVVKSFGKFWGLAGLRLGFLIGDERYLRRMADAFGPWPVSGPALEIGARALSDVDWSERARARLARESARLDTLMRPHCGSPQGTTLFRLYDVEDAAALHDRLARAQIWTRVFPYNPRWIRLGLPGREEDWARLQNALGSN
ncbi:MAG: pyridoxal phosphate-dependent class II aminotransferase [Dinoroseobacter sp.]|nr:pyridoxal phosphate-dependent class II aminotransferase [Dinoroseobacter sp.]